MMMEKTSTASPSLDNLKEQKKASRIHGKWNLRELHKAILKAIHMSVDASIDQDRIEYFVRFFVAVIVIAVFCISFVLFCPGKDILLLSPRGVEQDGKREEQTTHL